MSSSPTPEFRRARFGAPLIVLAAVVTACGGGDTADVPSDPSTETYAPSLGVKIADMTMKTSGLYVQDLTLGTGLEAIAGRNVVLQYTGWLVNGQQFDKNTTSGIAITLGRGQVIAGWDLGIVGMRPGGKRKLVIASALGYGSSGSGSAIGPNQTLVFDVTLLSVV